MVDGRDTVGSTGVAARLRQHAVAVGHEVHRIRISPWDRVLLKRLEPVVENLRVGPERVSGVGSLNKVLMQKGDCGLDELTIGREKKRKSGRSGLAKHQRACLQGSPSEMVGYLVRLRQFRFTNDLNDVGFVRRSTA